jgi:hypothetical protein
MGRSGMLAGWDRSKGETNLVSEPGTESALDTVRETRLLRLRSNNRICLVSSSGLLRDKETGDATDPASKERERKG